MESWLSALLEQEFLRYKTIFNMFIAEAELVRRMLCTENIGAK